MREKGSGCLKNYHVCDICRSICMLLTHCRGLWLPTEDKVWTIVSHDLQLPTTVAGYSPEKYSVTQLVYSASMEQIGAITSSAEYCEQYVSYFCKMSRLLNTPGRPSSGCFCEPLSRMASPQRSRGCGEGSQSPVWNEQAAMKKSKIGDFPCRCLYVCV